MAGRAHSQASLLPIVCGALVVLALSVGAAAMLVSLRTSALDNSKRELRNMSLVLAEQADRAFQAVELVQTSLIETVRSKRIASADAFRSLLSGYDVHLGLSDRISGLPHVDAIALIDRDGRLFNSSRSWPASGISVARRDYFQALRADPQRQAFVGAPVRNPVTGRWTIQLARKVTDPGGELLGLILGVMDLQYFERLFASISLPGGSIALLRDDGVELVRVPPGRANAEIDGKSDLFAPALSTGDHVARVTSRRDGQEHVVTAHRTQHYPVIAAVGLSVDAALASWRQQVRYLLPAAILIDVVIVAVIFLGARQTRAHDLLARAEAERARAEGARAIAEAERRDAEILTATISSMADAVLVTDETGKILIANPAAEHLFGRWQEIGTPEWMQTYARFLPDGRTPLPPEQSPIRRAVRGELVDDCELVLRRPGATKDLHLIANGRPLRDATGALRGAVVVYRNVTETKEYERQLRHAQKMDAIGQLTGGIAHDFNNILTVITSTIDILSAGVKDRPTLATIARMIDDAASRGGELTQRLLAFARRQPLQPRRVNTNQIVTDTARLLRPALGEQYEIEAVLAEDASPALVDPSQLTTALINLAVNARDAMPNGGRLVFTTSNVVLESADFGLADAPRAGDYVKIMVTDTGCGIPEAIRDKIFDPFFTTKPVGKGTGLGLSMVYGFIRQSGGHIKIESEEGRGTSISLYLPPATEEDAAGVDDLSRSAWCGGNETILIVEDDTLVRYSVCAQLESLGYRTHAAANAAEALALIDKGTPVNLLFTDVIMPGEMDGRQLAEAVMARRPGIKVLYTSGYSEDVFMQDGHLAPGVRLLHKPYRKMELARMVRETLDAETGDTREPALAATAA